MTKPTGFNRQFSCPLEFINNDQIVDDRIINLNVGGHSYCTLLSTLVKQPKSWLGKMFLPLKNSLDLNLSVSLTNTNMELSKDSDNCYFIDRDGYLFQFVLEFLRTDRIYLPENFDEVARLKSEFEFYKVKSIYISTETDKLQTTRDVSLSNWYYRTRTINVGYQGTFGFGRDGVVDVKFRKIYRILIAGHASLCRWVFEDTLNDNRDPERFSEDRYSNRFYLKHNNLELAFDMLYAKGFDMAGGCASGTHGGTGQMKLIHHNEESRWQHYNEFIFARRSCDMFTPL